MEVIATSENQADSQSLSSLAFEANKYHELANNESMLARSHVSSALHAAIQCGKHLSRAKDLLDHGEFMLWVQKNCPRIAHRTASRYMKLANDPNWTHVANISDGTASSLGLRQAYLLADIIQEPKKSWLNVPDPEAQNAGVKQSEHEPEINKLDPMDGKTSDEFPYELLDCAIDGATTVEFLDGDKRQVYSMAAQGLKVVLKWILKGDANTVLSRTLACAWVLGLSDEERFESFPSQHDMAISYGLHPTGVSRNAAEFSRSYDVFNRAQAHGDGVRK